MIHDRGCQSWMYLTDGYKPQQIYWLIEFDCFLFLFVSHNDYPTNIALTCLKYITDDLVEPETEKHHIVGRLYM